MAKLFSIFLLLQTADFATTAVTMRLGATELNPVVHAFMSLNPLTGLLLAKVGALVIGAACALSNKRGALQKANLVFTAIVLWNVTILARLLA